MQMSMVYGKHQAINNHSWIESLAPVWNWYFQINSNDSLTPDEISLDVFQIIWMISRFNSSPPSAAYMHQWTGSALVQIIACRLFRTTQLPEPMLT